MDPEKVLEPRGPHGRVPSSPVRNSAPDRLGTAMAPLVRVPLATTCSERESPARERVDLAGTAARGLAVLATGPRSHLAVRLRNSLATPQGWIQSVPLGLLGCSCCWLLPLRVHGCRRMATGTG